MRNLAHLMRSASNRRRGTGRRASVSTCNNNPNFDANFKNVEIKYTAPRLPFTAKQFSFLSHFPIGGKKPKGRGERWDRETWKGQEKARSGNGGRESHLRLGVLTNWRYIALNLFQPTRRPPRKTNKKTTQALLLVNLPAFSSNFLTKRKLTASLPIHAEAIILGRDVLQTTGNLCEFCTGRRQVSRHHFKSSLYANSFSLATCNNQIRNHLDTVKQNIVIQWKWRYSHEM